jgi:hypothetical protein
VKEIAEALADTNGAWGHVKADARLDRAPSSAVTSEGSRWTSVAMRFACLVLAAGMTIQVHAGSTLAPGKNYAQELVNQTLAKYRDLLVVAMHVRPPGASENVIIASNIGRIGKRADAEDRQVITTGENLAKVNRSGDRFEVELVLRDAAGKAIGAIAIVFSYKAGDDKKALEERAEAIRDELSKQIEGAAALMQPHRVVR